MRSHGRRSASPVPRLVTQSSSLPPGSRCHGRSSCSHSPKRTSPGTAFAMDHCVARARWRSPVRWLSSTSTVPVKAGGLAPSKGQALRVQSEVHDPKGYAILRTWLERSWNNEDRTTRDLEQPVCHAAEEQTSQGSVFDIAKDNKVSID